MNHKHLGLVISGVLGVVVLGLRDPDSLQTSAHAAELPSGSHNASSGPLLLKSEEMDIRTDGSTVAQVDPILTNLGPSAASALPLQDGARCPTGMQAVEGDYCPVLEQKCLRWLDPESQMRCAEFAPTSTCLSKTVHKKFCIDQYEFPNKVGEKPVVMKTWYEARDACAASGKRLCGDSEWTLACEGQERLPYPYGYARNADACNIDKPHPEPNERLLANPKTRDEEVARLDQRDPSGAREACVSPYNVHDMTGNVDEWVVNESHSPYQSGLKGGYWGPVRTRCRPMTVAHYEAFAFYQIGFRCCSDTPKNAASVTSPVEGPVSPTSNKAQSFPGI